MNLLDIIYRLFYWIKKEGYSGWDPYDGMMIKSINNKFMKFLFMQANLYSPFNLRDALHISKGISNKSIAILARSYILLDNITGDGEFKKESDKFCKPEFQDIILTYK